MRYEKQKKIIDQDKGKLQSLLDEYVDIQERLYESLQKQDIGKYYTDIVSFITKISDYIFKDSEKTKKGLEETMGGKVLELESEKLIRKGAQTTIEETVSRMRKSGKFTEEDIVLATGLDLETIRKIK